MLEDRLLVFRMKQGNSDALQRIYEKYKSDLLSVATSLLYDVNTAEDVVHDVFLSFVKTIEHFNLTGSLKSYLITCVVNRCRDKYRMNRNVSLEDDFNVSTDLCQDSALHTAITNEEIQRIRNAIARLPYEQREVVILHLQARVTFRHIAKLYGTSISTIQSRYRYGLIKLKAFLDGKVEK